MNIWIYQHNYLTIIYIIIFILYLYVDVRYIKPGLISRYSSNIIGKYFKITRVVDIIVALVCVLFIIQLIYKDIQ